MWFLELDIQAANCEYPAVSGRSPLYALIQLIKIYFIVSELLC
jgi:hypothetical protein